MAIYGFKGKSGDAVFIMESHMIRLVIEYFYIDSEVKQCFRDFLEVFAIMLLCRPLKRKVDRSRFAQVTSMWAENTREEKD